MYEIASKYSKFYIAIRLKQVRMTAAQSILSAFILLAICAHAISAHAQEVISAPQAYEKAMAGEIVLVDVRSREEWADTGIASVAFPLSMHERGFLEGLGKLRAENPGKEIAMICATGGRTKFLQGELEKRGLGKVIDVSEGMMGNGSGKGWIKRGLPMRKWPE